MLQGDKQTNHPPKFSMLISITTDFSMTLQKASSIAPRGHSIFPSAHLCLFAFTSALSKRTQRAFAKCHISSVKWQQQTVTSANCKGRLILFHWMKDLLLLQQIIMVLLSHTFAWGSELGVSQLFCRLCDSNMQDHRILRGYNFHNTFS